VEVLVGRAVEELGMVDLGRVVVVPRKLQRRCNSL